MIFLGLLVVLQIVEMAISKPVLLNLVGLGLVEILGGKEIKSLTAGTHRVFTVKSIPSVGIEASGMTLGEVVLVREESRGSVTLEIHESVHVKQAKRWGSLGFLLIYVLSWLWLMVRYRNWEKAYLGIPFEVEARKHEHGGSK